MDARRHHRVGRSLLVALGVGVLWAAVPAGTASAHAIVIATTPSDGSALLAAPSEVVVMFSEPMMADGMEAEITAQNATLGPVVSAELDPRDATRVVVRLGAIADGTYQVRVSARDAEDLHPVVARISFAVGQGSPAPSAPVVSGPEPIETAARWMFAAGFALLVGVIAVRTRPGVPIERPGRLRTIALAGIALALGGRVGVLVARMVSLGGHPLDAARTVMGTSDAQRLVLVVVALGCVAKVEQRGRGDWLDVAIDSKGRLTCRQALGWFGVTYLAVLASWGGHSALEGTVEPTALLAKTAHLMGLGLWVGVLAVVLLVSTDANRRLALAAMSQVAMVGALLTVVSGLVLTSRLVVSLTALAATPYGLMLTAKITLVAGAAGLGLHLNRHANRSIGELVVLTAVVLVGAALATATPAIDHGFTDAAPVESTALPAITADDLVLQVRAIPARPGANTLELRVGETRRPTPGAVTSVEVRTGDVATTVVPTAAGLVFVDGVDLPAGLFEVGVVVHRRDWADTSTTLAVTTDVPAWTHNTVISSALIRGPLLALAVTISLVGGILLRARPLRQRIRVIGSDESTVAGERSIPALRATRSRCRSSTR